MLLFIAIVILLCGGVVVLSGIGYSALDEESNVTFLEAVREGLRVTCGVVIVGTIFFGGIFLLGWSLSVVLESLSIL